MSKAYVMGDIHGDFEKLLLCLRTVNFDYNDDTLIQLGDVCDRGSDTYKVVEELLKIKKLIPIRGNHDDWFKTWLISGQHPCRWLQGGDATLRSYCKSLDKEYNIKMSGYITNLEPLHIPQSHIDFFTKLQIKAYIDNDNRLFVHGGLNRHFSITDNNHNNEDVLMWDRDFWMSALSYGEIKSENNIKHKFKIYDNFKEVFIGHTSTINWGTHKPMNAANVWNLDTGCGYDNGKLTIMNIDTKEYYQV